MKSNPQIAIDFRWLDHLSLGNGQFRYAVDLICGLSGAPSEMRYVVLGSKPNPVVEIANVFADAERWRYVGLPRLKGRGSLYREYAQYFRWLRGMPSSPLLERKTKPGAVTRIDLFHALHSFLPLYPPVPVVETVYDTMMELFPEYVLALQSREYRLHRWAFKKFCTRAIAISQTTRDDLAKLWAYPNDRIDVVYLSTKLAEHREIEPRPGEPFILAPYNLEPRKNLSRLLEAIANLNSRGTRLKLMLFGRAAADDERERGFREEVSRLRLDGHIELTGRVSDEELVNLYRACSVFVFPSLYEGFGLPVLEAMSLGARIVAHHASAMAEVVGDAGYLVDMNNSDALSNAIMAAISDGGIGAKALARAKDFSRERMARETMAVYGKLLSGPRA